MGAQSHRAPQRELDLQLQQAPLGARAHHPGPPVGAASLARPAFAPPSYSPAGAPRQAAALPRRQAKERRKNVLFALAGIALITLAAAVMMGGAMVYLHLFADLLLGGYIVLLVQTQRLAMERQHKVRYLQQPAYVDYDQPAPLYLQHSAN